MDDVGLFDETHGSSGVALKFPSSRQRVISKSYRVAGCRNLKVFSSLVILNCTMPRQAGSQRTVAEHRRLLGF